MHLWPSLAIRDSFKDSYLRNFEWNLSRMRREKQNRSEQQKLLAGDGDGGCRSLAAKPSSENSGKRASGFVGDALMVLSCFYCCFCCGGGDDG